MLALGFMALVAAINFRGVGESVKANVVLTCVELSGLLMIIIIGLWAQMPQYRIAAWLLSIGPALWLLTWAWNRAVRHRPTTLQHPEDLAEHAGDAPTN